MSSNGIVSEQRPLWCVRAFPGKGLGAAAVEALEPGSLIAHEKPLFVVPWWARKDASPEPFPGSELKRAVEEAVDSLDELSSQRFYELCDSKCEEGEEKSPMGIWRTNNFCLGRSGPRTDNGIFDMLSRFNHSCVPNAEFHWNPTLKRQEIRAIKRIKADAEITLCYVTGHVLSQPTSERRRYLLSCYGFECACAACAEGDEAAAEEGDRLRAKVAECAERIEKLVYHKNGDEEEENGEEASEEKVEADLREALALAEQQLRLMTSLGFKVVSRLDVVDLILDLSSDLEDHLTARFYYQSGVKLSRTVYGSASSFTIDWQKKYAALK